MTVEEAKAQAGEFVDFEDARTALRKAETDQESQGARMRTMLADSLPKTPAMEGLEKLLDKQDAATGGEKDKAGLHGATVRRQARNFAHRHIGRCVCVSNQLAQADHQFPLDGVLT
jgi:hypothetical protein